MGVILSAAYMVAKGTDLLTRAKFCKRAFVKLLQKVVSLKTFLGKFLLTKSCQFSRVLGRHRQKNNYKRLVDNARFVMMILMGPWFSSVPTFFVNCALGPGLIVSKHVRCAVLKSSTIRLGGTARPHSLINFIEK